MTAEIGGRIVHPSAFKLQPSTRDRQWVGTVSCTDGYGVRFPAAPLEYDKRCRCRLVHETEDSQILVRWAGLLNREVLRCYEGSIPLSSAKMTDVALVLLVKVVSVFAREYGQSREDNHTVQRTDRQR